MTIISHKHQFIFLCQRKTASTSISIALNEVLGEDDIFLMSRNKDIEYDASLDEDPFSIVRKRPINQKVFDNLSDREQSIAPHLPIDTVIKIVGEEVWNSYFKFAVIRNPWDWFASMYFFVMHRAHSGDLFKEKLNEIKSQIPRLINYPINYRLIRRLCSSMKDICVIKCVYYMYRIGRHRTAMKMLIDSGAYQYIFDDAKAFYFLNDTPELDAYVRYEHLNEDFNDICERLQLPQLSLVKTKTKPRRNQPKDYETLYNEKARRRIAQECADLIKHFKYSF